MHESTIEATVVLMGCVCLVGTVIKIRSLRDIRHPLCQDIRRDWFAELATYMVGVTFAFGRLLDSVVDWSYMVTAGLNAIIYAANFGTSYLVWRRIRQIGEEDNRG